MPSISFPQRRGTAAQWTAANTVLLDGQIGLETDTQLSKIGNGVTAWSSLGYTGPAGPTGPSNGATVFNTVYTDFIGQGTNQDNGAPTGNTLDGYIVVSRPARIVGIRAVLRGAGVTANVRAFNPSGTLVMTTGNQTGPSNTSTVEYTIPGGYFDVTPGRWTFRITLTANVTLWSTYRGNPQTFGPFTFDGGSIATATNDPGAGIPLFFRFYDSPGFSTLGGNLGVTGPTGPMGAIVSSGATGPTGPGFSLTPDLVTTATASFYSTVYAYTVIPGATFIIPPGRTVRIEALIVYQQFFSTSSGFALAVRVSQPSTANANATGAATITVARQATNSTEQLDGSPFNVAPGTNVVQDSSNTNTAITTNFSAWARAIVKNQSTNAATTITVEYAVSSNTGFTVQLQVGSSVIQLLD